MQEPLKERTQSFLTRHLDKNKFEFEWLGMKLDAEFTSGEEQQGFKATVRMRRDSAVSVSISPALGIEVLRLLVDKDSLKMVSDIPGDRYVFLGSVDQLSDLAKIDLDLSTLQDLLIGNPEKANEKLNWYPKYDLPMLVKEMMINDLTILE